MALESATYISDLVATNPVGATDTKAFGDDHLRLIKSTLLATFPNITGAVTLTQTQLNNAVTLTGLAANYMVFYQAAAPTGWTQLTALSNLDGATLRVETGTGGGAVSGTYDVNSPPSTAHTHSVAGTSGSTTLSAAQSGLPSHQHLTLNTDVSGVSSPSVSAAQYVAVRNVNSGSPDAGYWLDGTSTPATTGLTSATGGTAASSGHTHSFSATSGSASPTTFAVKHVNVIICSKN